MGKKPSYFISSEKNDMIINDFQILALLRIKAGSTAHQPVQNSVKIRLAINPRR
jgi:hypothetical protein